MNRTICSNPSAVSTNEKARDGIFIIILFSAITACSIFLHRDYIKNSTQWWHWIFPIAIYLGLIIAVLKVNLCWIAQGEWLLVFYQEKFFYYFKQFLQGKWLITFIKNISNRFALINDFIFSDASRPFIIFLSITSIFYFSLLFFYAVWQNVLFPGWKPDTILTIIISYSWPTLVVFSIFWGFCFLLIALNPRTHTKRSREEATRVLNETLDTINTDLTQMNLAVAAMHISVSGRPSNMDVDELLLRDLDTQLKVKESLISVEKIILARKRDVDDISRSIKADQQRARRAVTSSIGGVGVGFLTYGLGSSIKNFVLLNNKQHPINMQFWLESSVQHKSANDVYMPTLTTQLNNNYTQPEIFAEASLLTITLLVSIFAAWVGWQKAVDE